MKYKKLSGEERWEIGILHEKGYSARSIAKQSTLPYISKIACVNSGFFEHSDSGSSV